MSRHFDFQPPSSIQEIAEDFTALVASDRMLYEGCGTLSRQLGDNLGIYAELHTTQTEKGVHYDGYTIYPVSPQLAHAEGADVPLDVDLWVARTTSIDVSPGRQVSTRGLPAFFWQGVEGTWETSTPEVGSPDMLGRMAEEGVVRQAVLNQVREAGLRPVLDRMLGLVEPMVIQVECSQGDVYVGEATGREMWNHLAAHRQIGSAQPYFGYPLPEVVDIMRWNQRRM